MNWLSQRSDQWTNERACRAVLSPGWPVLPSVWLFKLLIAVVHAATVTHLGRSNISTSTERENKWVKSFLFDTSKAAYKDSTERKNQYRHLPRERTLWSNCLYLQPSHVHAKQPLFFLSFLEGTWLWSANISLRPEMRENGLDDLNLVTGRN
jgi:hypothetical protein